MSTTIRTFRHGKHRYRHVICLDTDEVFLQRLNADAEMSEDEWISLMRYDSGCSVWDAKTGERIGHFRNVGKHWWFYPPNSNDFLVCEHTSGAESILDFEVTVSKRWLTQQSLNEAPQ